MFHRCTQSNLFHVVTCLINTLLFLGPANIRKVTDLPVIPVWLILGPARTKLCINCVCIYICIYIYMYIYVCIYICIHRCMYIYICVHSRELMWMFRYLYVFLYLCVSIWFYVFICICMYVYVFICLANTSRRLVYRACVLPFFQKDTSSPWCSFLGICSIFKAII